MRRGVLIVACWALWVSACGKGDSGAKAEPATKAPTSAASAALAAPPEPPPLPKRTPLDDILEKQTFADAVDYAKPFMGDATDDPSPGTMLLAVWSAEHLKWADVANPKGATTIPRIMKDADAERGKLMCQRVGIIEIYRDSSVKKPLFTGGALTNDMDILRFAAAGSTGELVKGSEARFCGVVIGRVSYANNGGGTTHAVQLVGMFDLPENRIAAK